MTDKTHAYPEPVEPPADYRTSSEKHDQARRFPDTGRNGFGNKLHIKRGFDTRQNFSSETCSSHFSNPSVNTTQINPGHDSCFYNNVGTSPMFGRAVFPNYVSREPVPKVVWVLTPMLIPNQPTNPPMLDQITQYEPQEMFTGVRQFQNCKNPFQSNTPKNGPTFDQMFPQRVRDTFDSIPRNKEVGCQTMAKRRPRATSLSEFIPKTILKSSRSVNDLRTSDTKTSPVVDDSANSTERLGILKDNDLRLVLVAKRRQSVSLDDTSKSAGNYF